MQRNGQNPIKAAPIFNKGVGAAGANPDARPAGGHPRCPACQAEVPPKPGFRPSAMKCPKCGASMAKK